MNNFDQFVAWEATSKDTIDFKRSYADMVGDVLAGLVLSEIVYWHLPAQKTGLTKLRVQRGGHKWIACRRDEWWDRARLTPRQFDAALELLVESGVIAKEIHGFSAKRSLFIRIDEDKFIERFNVVTTGDNKQFYPKAKPRRRPSKSQICDYEDKSQICDLTDEINHKSVTSNTAVTSTATTQDEEQSNAKALLNATAIAASADNEPAISQSDLSQHSDSALMTNGEASSDAEQSQSDITTPAVALEQTPPAAPAEEKKAKGKRAKKEKPADPDAAAIAALINAWKVESKVIDPAAFSKKPYRDCAREMIALGITADHVKGCTADLKDDPYWSGRALPFTTVAQNVVAWAEENTLSEHPDSLPIYEIKPNDEYPSGLPYGIKPDDPRAAIYRFDPTAADDPTVLEMTSSLWSDERDFYAKHDIPSPDAPSQHPTVKSQP
jgi:hypothetical protein